MTTPDHREPVEPSGCAGCGGDLADAPGTVASRIQVFDLPAFSLAVTEYLLMRRRCGCGHATTAGPPTVLVGADQPQQGQPLQQHSPQQKVFFANPIG